MYGIVVRILKGRNGLRPIIVILINIGWKHCMEYVIESFTFDDQSKINRPLIALAGSVRTSTN